MRPTSVIIGAGEIGQAIAEILESADIYRVYIFDILDDVNARKTADSIGTVDFLHICFPYGVNFYREVTRYQKHFQASDIVVHSTVPVGVCELLGVCHSPVRGKHYDMEMSLRSYTKFFSGAGADRAADHFLRAGVPVYVVQKTNTTELGKLLETTFLGLLIEWTKAVRELCDKYDLSYTEVWDKFITSYNEKCESLGQPKFPTIVPLMKKIGGHCVMPNIGLLPEDFRFKKIMQELTRG